MDQKEMCSEVQAYVNDQSENAKIALLELRKYILDAAPKATELFNYGIPAYALVENGKRDKQVMMAAYAKHIGFYPNPSVIEKFKIELLDYKQGKGSVQFPLNKPLPKELIQNMVKYRLNMLTNS